MKSAVYAVLTVLCAQQAAFSAVPEKQPRQQSSWMVMVNGSPVTREEVSKRLWASYAAQVVQTFIDEKLLRQEAAGLKLSVKQSDVDRLFDQTEQRFGKQALREEMFREGMTLEDFRQRLELRLLTEAVVSKKAAITVSDADIRNFFEQEKSSLGKPESVHLWRLLVKTEKEAQDAITELKKGKPFQELAAHISLDERTREAGGDMGLVERGMLLPPVEKAVFALPAGGVSAPIADDAGFYVLKVTEKHPAQPAEYAKLKEQLRETVLGVKIRQALPGVMSELKRSAKIEFPKEAEQK